MIHWPALIKFNGDDELLYISGPEQWDVDPDLHAHRYVDEDRLIDSIGKVYRLQYDQDKEWVELLDSGECCLVDELCTLLKAHFLCLQQCCVPKFYISSYSEGMRMLAAS